MFLTWPEDDIVIADPEGEYYPLVNRLGGQVVKLTPSASSGTYINPMDINPDYADDEDPLSLKSDFISAKGLCRSVGAAVRPAPEALRGGASVTKGSGPGRSPAVPASGHGGQRSAYSSKNRLDCK